MFQDSLKKLVDNVDGGIAGLLMGFDGIAVDSYTRDTGGLDIMTVVMEFSVILREVRRAAEALEIGGVQEVAIRSEKHTILLRVMNQEFFVALAITESGNFGKGRYLLRMVAPKLQAEL